MAKTKRVNQLQNDAICSSCVNGGRESTVACGSEQSKAEQSLNVAQTRESMSSIYAFPPPSTCLPQPFIYLFTFVCAVRVRFSSAGTGAQVRFVKSNTMSLPRSKPSVTKFKFALQTQQILENQMWSMFIEKDMDWALKTIKT